MGKNPRRANAVNGLDEQAAACCQVTYLKKKLQLQCARCRGLRVSCKSQLIEHPGSAVELLWGKGKRKERRSEEKERLSSYWESAKTK